MYHVISLRGLWPKKLNTGFVYVGRAHAGLQAHPLGNPFTGERALLQFAEWFHALPNLTRLLRDLRADTECGQIPIACWCGNWSPGQMAIPCHAYIIAQAMIERFPEDMKGGEW
jgi:hypothetical protein